MIVIDRGAVALAPALSEALTEKEAVELEGGTPEICPPALRDKPAGRPPDAIDHVYGAVPPFAWRV
jgi:hypothetical protein